MKNFKYFLVKVIAISLLFACEPDEEIVPNYNTQNINIPFDLEVTTVLSEDENEKLYADLFWNDNHISNSSFVVERSIDDSTHWTEIARLDKKINTFRDTELHENSNHYYRIKAINSDQNFNYSKNVNFFFKRTKIHAPSDLDAKPLDNLRINLTWKDNSDNEIGFIIERSLNGNDWTEIKKVKPNLTSYTDIQLQSETKYYYRVIAFNSDRFTNIENKSGSSNISSCQTMINIDNPLDIPQIPIMNI